MAKRVASLYAELGLKTDKFKQETGKAKKDLADLASNFGNVGSIASLALGGAVVGGAIAAGKAIYEMGKQGAIVAQTGESFEYMAKKVGLADDILDQLRRASRGTIDDMTLMSSTTTLLAGASDELARKLGDATPRLLEIAKAANKLNPSLGDTAFLYESIATGVKRASPLILDNLGLTISIGEANAAYAKSLGKSVEQLTEEEKKIALLNATLSAGNNLIRQVGGNLDSASDAFARNQVAVKNLTDEMAEKTAPAVSRIIEKLNDAIPVLLDFLEPWPELEQALHDNIVTTDEYNGLLAKFYEGEKGAADAVEYLNRKVDDHNLQLQIAADRTGWAAGQNKEFASSALDAAAAVEEEAAKMSDFSAAFGNLDLSVSGPIGKELDDFKKEQDELVMKAQEVQGEIDELNSVDYLSKEQEGQLDTAKKKLDEINGSIRESIKAHEEAQKRLVFDILTDQIRSMEEFDPQLAVRATGEVAKQLGLVDDETVRVMGGLSDAIAQLAQDENIYRFNQNVEDVIDNIGVQTTEGVGYVEGLKGNLDALVGDYEVNIKINTQGALPGGVVQQPSGQGFQNPDVTGRQRLERSGGGDTFVINNNSSGAAALTNSYIEERRRSRLNQSMNR